jgi:hypothetical protein
MADTENSLLKLAIRLDALADHACAAANPSQVDAPIIRRVAGLQFAAKRLPNSSCQAAIFP